MILWFAEQIHADTGLDLAAYALAGLPATVGAITALVIAVKSLRHNEEIREQVSNDHDTNLRDDVDRIEGNVKSSVDKVDQVDTKVDQLTGKFEILAQGLELFMRESREAQARQDRIAAKYHPNEP